MEIILSQDSLGSWFQPPHWTSVGAGLGLGWGQEWEMASWTPHAAGNSLWPLESRPVMPKLLCPTVTLLS